MELSSPRKPLELFGYMARFSNAAEWDPGVRSASDLTTGDPALGSAYRLLISGTKAGIPLTYTIVEFSAPTRVVLLARNSVVTSRDTIEIAPSPTGGSTLRYEAELRGRGVFAVFEPLLKRVFQKMGRRAEASLAVVLST